METGDRTLRGIVRVEDLPKLRKRHARIALCSGCYDVLQSGHAVFFEQCKAFADALVVSVGRDDTVRTLKGPGRPVNPENNRLFLVAALEDVDYAVLGDEEVRPGKIDFYEVMRALRPDVFVLNSDDRAVVEKEALCRELGVELRLVERTVPEFLTPTSTTEILGKLREC